MIDLKKEIEGLKNNINTEDYKYNMGCIVVKELENETIDKVLQLLDQYNIITAPKTIKLSEIVSKLNEIFNDSEFSREIYFNRKLNAIGEGEYDKDWFMNTWTPFIRFKENKISEIINLESERTKWLYTLWIAGTIIEDD